jgi:hypothetical protein
MWRFLTQPDSIFAPVSFLEEMLLDHAKESQQAVVWEPLPVRSVPGIPDAKTSTVSFRISVG